MRCSNSEVGRSRNVAGLLPRDLVVGRYEREATLPYALHRVESARYLLVSFPALTAAAAEPLVEVGKYLGDLHCHRLYIGADEDFYVGPDGTLAGAHTAVHLIWREARRLGIDEHEIACIGSSFRALCALYIGLKARSGLVIAGAPPARMGRWIAKLVQGSAPGRRAHNLRHAIAAVAGIDETLGSQQELDRLPPRAVARATHEANIHLFVSRQDPVYAESEWLRDQLAGHPSLRSHLTVADYGDHAQIKVPFYRYVRGTVRRVIAEQPA